MNFNHKRLFKQMVAKCTSFEDYKKLSKNWFEDNDTYLNYLIIIWRYKFTFNNQVKWLNNQTYKITNCSDDGLTIFHNITKS